MSFHTRAFNIDGKRCRTWPSRYLHQSAKSKSRQLPGLDGPFKLSISLKLPGFKHPSVSVFDGSSQQDLHPTRSIHRQVSTQLVPHRWSNRLAARRLDLKASLQLEVSDWAMAMADREDWVSSRLESRWMTRLNLSVVVCFGLYDAVVRVAQTTGEIESTVHPR